MDSSFQELLKRLDHLSGQFRELKEGVHKAAAIASHDPEMALTRARKVLEYVIRDVYERRINEPPGTRTLENLLQRLVKEGHWPTRLEAYANTVRMLGNVGTHRFGESITAADVYQSLTQLMPILEWYFEVERPEALGQKAALTSEPVKAKVLEPSFTSAVQPDATMAVVPKGLRSFDAQDADFFLDLLPGPRDKNGLPESIRFWKHRIEACNEMAFTIGIIYGPSGCGKSSLVKAGLLPRLANHVVSIYVEATAADTEARLLKGLRKRCPDLSSDLDLTGTIAFLRQGKGLSRGQKVFIVLDQFEQWLHSRREEENVELAQALRQCDGEHVQCVLLVRDDFWMGLTRFLQDLQIELLQGQNCAPVDLFDLIHARQVLAAFGRAFGRLEQNPTKVQDSFLDQAVQGLSENGRLICVRLALFAEMVKGKRWTPASLKEVGGPGGVGLAFLEETFAAATAPAAHRLHQKAAQGMLKALLPEAGTDLKGHMRSHKELLDASGYGSRPKDFAELLHILDGELRLITPTDPEEKDEGGRREEEAEAVSVSSLIPHPSSLQYYQLTHDYLVPSLRDWLSRKQKETRRGRAELALADRASVWNTRPENRQLPSLAQWLQICRLTRPQNWTPPQRKMMQKATRYHGVRGLIVALLLTAVTVTGLIIRGKILEQQHATHAAGLVRRLLDAEMVKVPEIIRELKGYRAWTDPLLKTAYAEASRGTLPAASEKEMNRYAAKQLRSSLGLLPGDPGQVKYLYGQLLFAEPQEVIVIRDEMLAYKKDLLEPLWAVVNQHFHPEDQRLRAACALAAYDPENPQWKKVSAQVVDQLVEVNPTFLRLWLEGFRDVKGHLVGPLRRVFREGKATQGMPPLGATLGKANLPAIAPPAKRNASSAQGTLPPEQYLACSILAEYIADDSAVLADLLMDADGKQFAMLYPKFKGGSGLPVLTAEIARKLPPEATQGDREDLAKRQANAAVVLFRMGDPGQDPTEPALVWRLLKHSPDPRVRSCLIHRLDPLGLDASFIIHRVAVEPDVSTKRALVLSLGAFTPAQLSSNERASCIPKVIQWYREQPDPGLHGAAEWLLRRWQQDQILREMNEQWAKDQPRRVKSLIHNRTEMGKPPGKRQPQWHVNGQGHTMVVVPGPVEFQMGSPPEEAGRQDGPDGKLERQHLKRIDRSFAIAAKEVTVAQFRRFRKDHPYDRRYSPTPDCPVNKVTWYDAAAYCNWLSDREGLPETEWCYLPNEHGKYADGMKPAPNYLQRRGYRLPTEAEWEFACRAKTQTSRYYGETEELLGQYAWYTMNSQFQMWPGGTLMPNDLGLFDMLGNAVEWCQEQFKLYGPKTDGRPSNDIEDHGDIKDMDLRVLRGGSLLDQAVVIRSAQRLRFNPTIKNMNVGFRPARTIAAE